MRRIQISDWGIELTSRPTGAVVREAVETALGDGADVVIDCAGVTVIAPSFADECFGKLLSVASNRERSRLSVEHLAPELRPLVRFSIGQRRSPTGRAANSVD